MERAIVGGIVIAGLTLAGCSGTGAAPVETVTVTQSATVTATATPSLSPTQTPSPSSTSTPSISSSAQESQEVAFPDALSIATYLAEEIDSAYDVEKVTVKNDPNDLLKRPGGYTSAAYIYDDNSESYDQGLDVDLGAKIEEFKTERDARSRYNYLKQLFADSPILGGEYTYIEGPVLLRVAQAVPPKVARKYRDAFREFLSPYM